ncbi:30S ribosomal protein S17 [Candidatus Pacearchaeota archaeon ex4484_71]|nr:MAG: 30S ribosomal protein S17 [Candidatus Pacearchaeota archaeon ex4484_71]
MKNKKTENKKVKEETSCKDRDCPFHGNLKLRGKTFKGTVVSKHPKRVAIEFERMVYVRKYERYAKTKTKIHARLPTCMERDVEIGDFVKIRECRPLSKIIHFVVVEKLNNKEKKE